MKGGMKLKYLGIIAVLLMVIAIFVAGCTTTTSNAPAPVQTTVIPVTPVVTQTADLAAEQAADQAAAGQAVQPAAQPVAASAGQSPPAGPIASAIAAQVPDQAALVNENINMTIEMQQNNPVVMGQTIPDLPFMQLYVMSSPQIVAKTDVVTLCLAASSYPGRLLYSPVTMNLAAGDLGFTAQQYEDKINTVKADNSSQEQFRMVYIKYLDIVKNTAYNIQNAANAESEGNYALAASYSQYALNSLQGFKLLPNQAPTSTLNRLNAYLTYYQYTMQVKASQSAGLANGQAMIQNSNLYTRLATS
jgi:hypothetical protein